MNYRSVWMGIAILLLVVLIGCTPVAGTQNSQSSPDECEEIYFTTWEANNSTYYTCFEPIDKNATRIDLNAGNIYTGQGYLLFNTYRGYHYDFSQPGGVLTNLTAVNASTGEIAWQHNNTRSVRNFFVSNETIYATTYSHDILSIDIHNGSVRWSTSYASTENDERESNIQLLGDTLYLEWEYDEGPDRYLKLLNSSTGEPISLEDGSTPNFQGDTKIVPLPNGDIIILDENSGVQYNVSNGIEKVLETNRLDSRYSAQYNIDQDLVVFFRQGSSQPLILRYDENELIEADSHGISHPYVDWGVEMSSNSFSMGVIETAGYVESDPGGASGSAIYTQAWNIIEYSYSGEIVSRSEYENSESYREYDVSIEETDVEPVLEPLEGRSHPTYQGYLTMAIPSKNLTQEPRLDVQSDFETSWMRITHQNNTVINYTMSFPPDAYEENGEVFYLNRTYRQSSEPDRLYHVSIHENTLPRYNVTNHSGYITLHVTDPDPVDEVERLTVTIQTASNNTTILNETNPDDVIFVDGDHLINGSQMIVSLTDRSGSTNRTVRPVSYNRNDEKETPSSQTSATQSPATQTSTTETPVAAESPRGQQETAQSGPGFSLLSGIIATILLLIALWFKKNN